ncbi:RICIN domain-containing protein, partial [Streptomyces sp. NPDC047043]|uniref:RICIN domain-containing protein n=1 Tax=Streptomyces sp. NPDC047043 TaxID=3154497 RepID=UPI00340BAA7F
WTARDVGYVRIKVNTATGDYANIGNLRIGARTARPKLKRTAFPAKTTFRLTARHSQKALTTTSAANGTPLAQTTWDRKTTQKWTLVPTGDGYFKIRNTATRTLLETAALSRADGGPTDIWTDADAPQQHWAITPTGDGYHLLTNRFSGLALNVDAASTADNATINQWAYQNAPQQQWQITGV